MAVAATLVVLATGLVDLDQLDDTARSLLPVVVFLVTILVVADVCARAGLFAAAARLVGWKVRSRRLLLTTKTLEDAMAALASIGLSRPSAISSSMWRSACNG